MDDISVEKEDLKSEVPETGWQVSLDQPLCRTCMKTEVGLIGIFEDGVRQNLAFKINEHLPIKVKEEDRLPNAVCYACASTLIAFHELVNKCIDSEKKLNLLLHQVSDSEKRLEVSDEQCSEILSVANDTLDEDDENDDDDDNDDSCDVPIEAIERNTVLVPEMASVNTPEIIKSNVSDNGILSLEENDVDIDANRDPLELSSPSSKQLQLESAEPSTSSACTNDVTFSKEKEPSDRELIKRGKIRCVLKRNCREQKLSTSTNELKNPKTCEMNQKSITLGNHKRLKDKGLLKYSVSAKDTSKKSKNRIAHSNIKEPCKYLNFGKKCGVNEQYVEKICRNNTTKGINENKDSKQNSSLDKGKDKGIPFKKRIRFQCLACNKVFALLAQYKNHYDEFHKNRTDSLNVNQIDSGKTPENELKCLAEQQKKTYMCEQCGKSFNKSSSFHYHINHFHSGIKNYACDICGRKFAQKHFVVEHRRIHTGERPYMCDLCGKAFKTSGSLKIHNRTHTDYYPFQCTLCSHKFRTQQHYSHHISIHTGEKKYHCDICERAFRIPGSLRRHKFTHIDVFPFSCKICSLTFRMKRYLKNHIKSKHIDSPDALNLLSDTNC